MLLSLNQLEQTLRDGDAAALKGLISNASQARGGWTLNNRATVVDE
jgi:hypothetical protein